MDTVVHDYSCLEGTAKTAQVFDKCAVDVGAVLAVEAMCEVFVFRVKNGDDLVGIFALKKC